MIIKRLEKQTDGTIIFDHIKKKRLFKFEDGIFETEDEYIISFWSEHYLGGVNDEPKGHDTEKPKVKKRGRPKKNLD